MVVNNAHAGAGLPPMGHEQGKEQLAAEQEIFVSGRLCLFGEHSDWAGGFQRLNPDIVPGRTIVVGTQEGLHARVGALPDRVLVMSACSETGDVIGPVTFPLEPRLLLAEARKGGFWSYVAGTAYQIAVHYNVAGLRIHNYKTTLPMSKGLSSSAAVCVMVARAFNVVYDLKLSIRGEMELAYQGEIATPSQCGRMDQACAYGGVPVLMTYEGDALHVEQLPLAATLHLVLVDLKASKCTTTILHCLQAAYPHPTTEQHKGLHQLLGPINEDLVERALGALASGCLETLGQLMGEAQQQFDSLAQPLCPQQLSAPVLHRILAHPSIQDHILGGKGVGSQGDGTAQFLCKSAEAQSLVCQLLEQECGVHCMPLTVAPSSSTTTTSVAPAAAAAVAVASAAIRSHCHHPAPEARTPSLVSSNHRGPGGCPAIKDPAAPGAGMHAVGGSEGSVYNPTAVPAVAH